MARTNLPPRRVRDERTDTEFYESLASASPRTYRDDLAASRDVVPTDPVYLRTVSPVEQVVRVAAGVLEMLLAIRFVVALFSSNLQNAVVSVLYTLTDWVVRPFQALFGTPPSGGGGYVDLPALAAIVFVALVAWVITFITRDYS